jgi:hypothetical protein
VLSFKCVIKQGVENLIFRCLVCITVDLAWNSMIPRKTTILSIASVEPHDSTTEGEKRCIKLSREIYICLVCIFADWAWNFMILRTTLLLFIAGVKPHNSTIADYKSHQKSNIVQTLFKQKVQNWIFSCSVCIFVDWTWNFMILRKTMLLSIIAVEPHDSTTEDEKCFIKLSREIYICLVCIFVDWAWNFMIRRKTTLLSIACLKICD